MRNPHLPTLLCLSALLSVTATLVVLAACATPALTIGLPTDRPVAPAAEIPEPTPTPYSTYVPLVTRTSPASFAVWAEGSTRKIGPTESPLSSTYVWDGQQVTLKAARNETEPFQLVITADQRPLTNVSVSIGDLDDGAGHVITSGQVSLFREHYVTVSVSYDEYGQPGTYPDALPPLVPFGLDQGKSQPIWVSIHVPTDTLPGQYNAQIAVTSDQGGTTLPLVLTVWDFALPAENHLDSLYPIGEGDLAAQYGFDEGDIESYNQVVGQMVDFLLARRLGPGVESYRYPVYSEDAAGTPQVDFSPSDPFHQKLLDSGVVRTLPMVLPTDAERKQWPMQANPEQFIFDETFHSKVITYFRRLYDHYEAKGWASQFPLSVYIYDDLVWVSDEPFHWGKTGYDRVRLWADWVHEANPNLKFRVADSPIGLGDDWGDLRPYTQIWDMYPEVMTVIPDVVQAEGQAGKLLNFNLNSYADFIDYPATLNRVLAWFAYKHGAWGLDQWGVDYWYDSQSNPINPWVQEPRSEWGAGAGALIYPGPLAGLEGPVSSIRLELNREMMEDYEFLWLLESLGGGEFARQVILDLIPNNDLHAILLTPKDFYQAREALAAEILARQEGGSGLAVATGTVEGSGPLSGVLVSTGVNATLTDDVGYYSLLIPAGGGAVGLPHSAVTFSKADYQTVTTTLVAGTNPTVTMSRIPIQETLLFSFEGDLSEWEWDQPHVTPTLSTQHVTHGSQSLKVTWDDVELAEVGTTPEVGDWQGQTYLAFDVYNPHSTITGFSVGLADQGSGYYEGGFEVGPQRGVEIRIRITEMGQFMDMAHVEWLGMEADTIEEWDKAELGYPSEIVRVGTGPKTLYFDHFRLVKEETHRSNS